MKYRLREGPGTAENKFGNLESNLCLEIPEKSFGLLDG